MASVRSANTKPERIVRSVLHAMGYRYRLHRRDLPGRPDIVFPSRRKVIDVRGCFWHRHPDPACRNAVLPRTRTEFWSQKLGANVARDERNVRRLVELGWDTLVLWECQLSDPPALEERLVGFLGPPGTQAVDG
ncbi:endonuclease [Methylobacterium sp. Leaf469]|nr:endonuclease [Methylobacterium sp. Leaf469]